MPSVNCAIVGCSNNTQKLRKWRQQWCNTHNDSMGNITCTCTEPFTLFSFPNVKDLLHEKWVQAVNRFDPVTKKKWIPNAKYSKVCSHHFVENEPTKENPVPLLNLGYNTQLNSSLKKPRVPPKVRVEVKPSSGCSTAKKNIEKLFTVPSVSNDMDGVSQLNNESGGLENVLEHNQGCVQIDCIKCQEKDNIIKQLKAKIFQLELEIKKRNSKNNETMCGKLLTSDSKVQFYTGLPSLQTFDLIYKSLEEKVHKMNYWRGPKYVSIRKIRTPLFNRSPKKFGPKRKLVQKDELLLVLMKLRLALVHEDIADRFGVSIGTVSSIINTWIKALSNHLTHLNIIEWPIRECIQAQLPGRLLSQYPYLRAIIDCTEIFIERPRELLLQAHTWSDYKKHNTAKILVSITPRGSFNFVSEAFGGRASDKYIVHESGFLELIEEYDQIMADNGFTIQDELLLRKAELVKPPPAQGFNQATAANVMKTKKVANIRIHVERAIQRLKTFRILSHTYPVTMLSILDDVINICACFCNFDRMLIE